MDFIVYKQVLFAPVQVIASKQLSQSEWRMMTTATQTERCISRKSRSYLDGADGAWCEHTWSKIEDVV